MLPFTKRPGRRGDSEVVTKVDLAKSPPNVSASNAEDEIATSVMPIRAFAGPLTRVLPAAGRPPSSAPPVSVRSHSASLRPSPSTPALKSSSSRMEDRDNDQDGVRTVVRDVPKILKRTKGHVAPRPMSPTAAHESTRANRRENLLPGPPLDLLEDRSDFADSVPSQRSFGRSRLPPSFEGPPSYPRGGHFGHTQHGPSSQPGRPGPDARVPLRSSTPPAPVSVPGVTAPVGSAPAHFMTPQVPHSDPPGTSVTSRHRLAGRPTTSWAVALLVCGLFVGVAGVTVIQSSEVVADTTASFVDPSRAPSQANAPAATPPASLPAPVTVPAVTVATPPPVEPPPVAVAPTAVAPAGPSPVQPVQQPVQQAHAPSAQPGAVPRVVPSGTVSNAASAKRPTFTWKPPPPPPKSTAKAPAPSADEETPSKKEAKVTKPGGKKGGEGADDETKKALEALQKAQLESASSFGKE